MKWSVLLVVLLLCLTAAEAKPGKGKGTQTADDGGAPIEPTSPPSEPAPTGSTNTSSTETSTAPAGTTSSPQTTEPDPSSTSTTNTSTASEGSSTTNASTPPAATTDTSTTATAPNGSTVQATMPVAPGDGTISTSTAAETATPEPTGAPAAKNSPSQAPESSAASRASAPSEAASGAGLVWLATGADVVLPATLDGEPIAQVVAWIFGIGLLALAAFITVRRRWVWSQVRRPAASLVQAPLAVLARLVPLGGDPAVVDMVRSGHHDAASVAAAQGATATKVRWSLERMAAKGALMSLPGLPRRYCLPSPAARAEPRAAHAYWSTLGQEIATRVIGDPCLSRSALQADGAGREVVYIDAIEEMVRAGLLVTINKDGAERVRASDLLARLHVRASSPP